MAAGPRPVVFLLSTYDRADLPDGVTASGAAAYLHKEELSPAGPRATSGGARGTAPGPTRR